MSLYHFKEVGGGLAYIEPYVHVGNRPPGSGSGARPGHELPGDQPGIDNTLPGGSGIPSNELPQQPPPNVAAGYTLVLIRKDGRWVYAAIAPGSPPPRPMPEPPPEHVGGRPPNLGGPDRPGQELPTRPARPDQGLPPDAQPRRP